MTLDVPPRLGEKRLPCGPLIAAVLGVLASAIVAAPARLAAQAVDPRFACTENGSGVYASARSGDTIFVAGNFVRLGPASGSGVPFALSSGAPLPGYAKVAGEVVCSISDERGGWYVGGDFVAVGGKRRLNLAHVAADGRVSDWAPRVNGPVRSLAMAGPRLFVGGQFDSIDGASRSRIAALAVSSGEVLDWGPGISGFSVDVILPREGKIILGGRFSQTGGQPRGNLAMVDSASGEVLPWRCDMDNWVRCLAVSDTTLFVGGGFYYVAGEVRRGLAAVGLGSGTVLPWDAHISRPYWPGAPPGALSLIARDTVLYVGGGFTSIGGVARQGLAALDVRSGIATEWNPRSFKDQLLGAGFSALVLVGDTMFVGGVFDSLGGGGSDYVAAVDLRTGNRLDWYPQLNRQAWTLSVSGNRLYVGGAFTSILGQWQERRHLAAFNTLTGDLLPWNPDANDYVGAIAVRDGIVYVGGAFSTIGGQPRRALAAIDAATGAVTPWDPSPDGWGVWSLLPRGESVIVGGYFDHIGGQARRSIAEVDRATGLATGWNPDLGPIVMRLVDGDSLIYASGDFSFVEGMFRGGIAAIDPVTGAVREDFPRMDGTVDGLTSLDGVLYLGGTFQNAHVWPEVYPRVRLAAIDPGGTVRDWHADADARVRSLAAHGNTVYVGGDFLTVGGLPREHVAAVSADSGTVREWNPGLDGIAWSLLAADDVVYVGGGFSRAGLWPQAGFAAIEPAERRVEPPLPKFDLALAQNAPNPAVGVTTIRFSLASSAIVDLAVFDIHGRRIATLLPRSLQDPGPHAVTLRTEGWPTGCYFYRLEANGRSLARRMVVLN